MADLHDCRFVIFMHVFLTNHVLRIRFLDNCWSSQGMTKCVYIRPLPSMIVRLSLV